MPDFTASQLDAVEYKALDACVNAGPGSGKTTVLVERYRRLIEDRNFDPRDILAITFTEKAAANMKAKILDKFRHNEELLRDLEANAWVSTIHGFCARLLRENAIAAGIDPRFTVLDARQSDDLQSECIYTALDELVAENHDSALALMEGLQKPRFAEDLQCAWDAIRSAGKTVEEVREMPSPASQFTPADQLTANLDRWPSRLSLSGVQREEFDDLREWVRNELRPARGVNLRRVPEPFRDELRQFRENLAAAEVDAQTAPLRQFVFDVLGRFEALYRLRKTQRGCLDFNDLERRTVDLLSGDDIVRGRVRSQFRQIMLDEFQDINEQQAELIRLVRGEDVFFAVGDINQSIYGFRHARPRIFLDYRTEVEQGGGQLVHLIENFRSRSEILSFVEDLLNGQDGIEVRALRAAADFKSKSEPSVEILRVLDDEEDEESGAREARWIAYRIRQLRAEFEFRDFAVLCRSHDAMTPILAEFDRTAIPYVCGRRQSFLLSREGLDIRALLSVIANPRDEISLVTVLRSDLVGLSDETLLRIRLAGTSFTSGFLLADFDEKLSRFRTNLTRWRADEPVTPLDLLIVRMLSGSGFDINENVEAFLRLTRSVASGLTLPEFLQELESIENAVSTESELSDEDQGNAVQVMTTHAAKGLEFKVTIIAAMHKGTQRSGATVTFTPEHGLGLKWKGPNPKDGVKDSWALANGERLKQREKAEENRLLYVAMTRAEQHLILSYSADASRRPGGWAKLLGDGDIITTDPPAFARAPRDRLEASTTPAVPRPVLTGQHDTSVNVTSLTVFAKCPRKYYLERYVGWNGQATGFDLYDAPEDESGTEMGSFVHEVLAGREGPYPEEAQQLANVFLESGLGRRAARSNSLNREWNFIADVGGTLVRGSIDLWFEENGEIYLIDYKTDRKANPIDYAPQLSLYAIALEQSLGKRPVGAYLHFLRSDTVTQISIDDVALTRAKDLVRQLAQAQNTFGFDLREGAQCHSCPYYRSLCPSQA